MRFIFLLAGLVLCSLTASAAGPPVTTPHMISHELDAFTDAILSGGPGKDGIPAIDRPQYWDIQRAVFFTKTTLSSVFIWTEPPGPIPSVSWYGMKS